MNIHIRGGMELIRRSLLGFTSGRGFFWSLAFGWMAPLLVYLFVWSSVAGQGKIAGFGQDDFIVYYLILMLVNQFTYPVSNWTTGDVIRAGGFSTWLLRPLPPIYEAIAGDIAMKVVCVPFAFVIVGILAVFLHPTFSFSLPFLLMFIPTFLLAQLLRFMVAYTLALLALWTNRADALLTLNDSLVFLLAGQVVPTILLPGVIQHISFMLPYRYMLGFPVEVLMGRLSWMEVVQGCLIQVGWLSIVILLYQFVWKLGLRRYSAVGG